MPIKVFFNILVSLAIFCLTLKNGVAQNQTTLDRTEGIGQASIESVQSQFKDLKQLLSQIDQGLGEISEQIKEGESSGSLARTIALVSAGVGFMGNTVAMNSSNLGSDVGMLLLASCATISQTISGVSQSIFLYQQGQMPAREMLVLFADSIEEISKIENSVSGAEKVVIDGVIDDLTSLTSEVLTSKQKQDIEKRNLILASAAQAVSTLSFVLIAKYLETSNRYDSALKASVVLGAMSNFAALFVSFKSQKSEEILNQITKTRKKLKAIAQKL